MPAKTRSVIRRNEVQPTLPVWATEGAVLVRKLVESKRWNALTQWLRVYRHVGYTATDVAGFFLSYFASGLKCGLKKFGEMTTPCREQLAALVGRRAFPSPSAVSRLLGSATEEEVRPIGPRLLLEAAGVAPLLKHPASGVRDTFGDRWDVFDSDATIQAIRERALPGGAELPKPRRHSGPDLAQPGYMGRKRGELRCSRGTLQHAGTGVWAGVVLSPARADNAATLPLLLAALDAACKIGELAREKAILRSDGAGGNVPWLTGCRANGTRYLTRWGHYSLLRQVDVQQRMATGAWRPVPSSGSGPKREAMDLGEVDLRPGNQTRAENGEEYAEIRSRIVFSRFKTDDEKSNIGQLVEGHVYELFATDLPADAWPSEEVVALYFGRSAEENRFAQEDRELGLDHLFSYNLPGQELACLFGLMVWNMRVVEGFAQHPPPLKQPPQIARASDGLSNGPPPPAVELPLPAPDATLTSSPLEGPAALAASAESTPSESGPTLHELLDELPWNSVLKRLGADWKRAPDGLGLLCPQGSLLHLCSARSSRPDGRPALRLLASESECRKCPKRAGCCPGAAKNVTVPLTRAQGSQLQPLIAEGKRKASPSQPPPPGVGQRHLPPRQPLQLHPLDPNLKPGPYLPSQERLIPSEFRHAFRNTCARLTVEVDVPRYSSLRATRPLGLALTEEERRRSRRPWAVRLAVNDLPEEVDVVFSFVGPRDALAKLGISVDKKATQPLAAAG